MYLGYALFCMNLTFLKFVLPLFMKFLKNDSRVQVLGYKMLVTH